ncbi:uncharacterized protein LOC111705321 [Eurytemora carolleeae]|uniref:uncharacterized protein LOC111705321 n=1 Tax=Eurytemora carolleeae TaxID=1294199 RepID=UPI000C761407|nr:uncharacterized protein LOC111705321 [Eurytemora carolleeae]|eukprot:XP_023333590.1 uncharacterized protein LOC111705321 [Eurytemora affinis]
MLYSIVFVFLLRVVNSLGESLLQNGDFSAGIAPWKCNNCDGEVINGELSITKRKADWSGPYQILDARQIDQLGGFLNLNISVNPSQDITVSVSLIYTKGGETFYPPDMFRVIAQGGEWSKHTEHYSIPETVLGADTIKLAVSADPVADFLIDNVFLEEQVIDSNWKKEANARIDTLRKRNVKVTIAGDPIEDLLMEVRQLTHLFPFGTAVVVDELSSCQEHSEDSAYCKFTAENFNWVVANYKFKWRYMEKNQGVWLTESQDKMMDWTARNNISVRGHCLLWAKVITEKNNNISNQVLLLLVIHCNT